MIFSCSRPFHGWFLKCILFQSQYVHTIFCSLTQNNRAVLQICVFCVFTSPSSLTHLQIIHKVHYMFPLLLQPLYASQLESTHVSWLTGANAVEVSLEVKDCIVKPLPSVKCAVLCAKRSRGWEKSKLNLLVLAYLILEICSAALLKVP